MTEKFTKSIRILPGYDKRPKKAGDPNYGIHGCTVLFTLQGLKGTVTFTVYTDWLPLHVQEEHMGKDVMGGPLNPFPNVCQVVVGTQPTGADLSYHSPEPRRDWQKEEPARDCDILPGGKCWSDGTGLGAERVRNRMLEEGDKGVWKFMGEYYYHEFIEDDGDVNFGDLIQKVIGAADDGEAVQ